MRVQHESGFILHSRNYSETSLLLEVFTQRHGRIGLIAKGARRPSSKLRGVLNSFQPLLISWSGRGDLPVLTGAEADGPSYNIMGSALYCGFYTNELLLRLLHRHDPHEALYHAYRAAVAALRINESNEAALRIFEKRLLQELGYGLVLDHDVVENKPIQSDQLYDYILERGPIQINPELPTRVQGVRVHGATLIALANETFIDSTILRDTKNLMRAVLTPHLGDKPLHSRRLFRPFVAVAGGVSE